MSFPEPPTQATLADARRSLNETRISVMQMSSKIDKAEAELEQLVHDSKTIINQMQQERACLQEHLLQTMAYLSPIRRLPTDLLSDIFMWSFEDYSCQAWILASVCSSWRRLALRMPRIWSKVRLCTSQNASADTIRLWLERSGDTVPLDIEIFLRVRDSPECSSRRRRRSLSPTDSPPPLWAIPPPPGVTSHYVVPSHHGPPPVILPPAQVPIILPPSPGHHDPWISSADHQHDRLACNQSRTSSHWGHIAIFYLVEQMHRWERFVFRFNKQFTSMGALKSISGDAPLLREFEVSSADPAFYPEWQWLPNASASDPLVLPNLRTLTLQHTPFKWSSPMLRTNLTTLNLRALPTAHLPLDRILYIIANNPSLQSLILHFQGVLPAILPLSPTTLHHLSTLSIGGHYFLSQLVDTLSLPALDTLTLDIEAREPIEDTISSLLSRSAYPALKHLAVAYGAASTSASFYYGPSGIVISWSALLSELVALRTLHIGGTPLEPLLAALGPPEEDTNNQAGTWACPRLESLGMRNCHTHSEGVAKLVQMVEARNPDGGSSGGAGGAGGPVRLKELELYDCASLGQDVVHWLKGRIEEVVCTEPAYERSPLNHPYL
ncbi:hypothetical protein L208DRAFT_1418372 [Tricholoma matsutake]|nr:hypothetical protein L208DRAFT_1418372 [Tricholoma matsutake 945]